jgi:hypothetical protein
VESYLLLDGILVCVNQIFFIFSCSEGMNASPGTRFIFAPIVLFLSAKLLAIRAKRDASFLIITLELLVISHLGEAARH